MMRSPAAPSSRRVGSPGDNRARSRALGVGPVVGSVGIKRAEGRGKHAASRPPTVQIANLHGKAQLSPSMRPWTGQYVTALTEAPIRRGTRARGNLTLCEH